MATFKIHPAIGVARVGNSPEFFIGPEHPDVPANWDETSRKSRAFKDKEGRILRQAARFRIFEEDDQGNAKEVTTASGAKIVWKVHIANRKAPFFTFNGQSGAETNPPYVGRQERPADAIEKEARGRGQPERKNRRNAHVPPERRRLELEIDPGEVVITSTEFVKLVDTVTTAPLKTLGEARLEADGSLVFLGGSGQTATNVNPPPPLDEYANNDGWFDDMGDGYIRAEVTLPDGQRVSVEGAWVIVGPPGFVPGMRNVVSLYDVLWDLAVRERQACRPGADPVLRDLVAQQQAWQAATNDFAPSYRPSFTRHIYPILSRAVATQDVHDTGRPSYHNRLLDWERLSDPTEPQNREEIIKRMRDPNSTLVDWKGMPRGLGDDYASLDEVADKRRAAPLPSAFLSLTQVQYALLKAWRAGQFIGDWTFGELRYAPVPVPGAITPHGLDQAALENCVGAPCYPGIEVSWLIRRPELYAGAFRLKDPGFKLGPLEFTAGFFSQQMALPWQADFYDCHKEKHRSPEGEELVFMWWTAQRPDDIRDDADSPFHRWVERFDKDAEDPADPDAITNLTRFSKMRTQWSELDFIVRVGDAFVRQK